MGTSRQVRKEGIGTGRAFNSRIYLRDVVDVIGIDTCLASAYTFEGNLVEIVRHNAKQVITMNSSSEIVKQTWLTLQSLSRTLNQQETPQAMIIGDKLPEKVLFDLLDTFTMLADTQTLGALACLLELDRRSEAKRPQL